MTQRTANNPAGETAQASDTERKAGPGQASSGQAPDGNADAVATAGQDVAPDPALAPDPVLAVLTERDELKDRLLRTLAEMENLRRRTEKEMADTRAYAMTAFARDMLGVADNLRRALENLPAETVAAADAGLKAMLDGVDLTERDLVKTFERHGIRQIDPKGEKFDPNRHQAMFEAPDPATPKGHVTQVVQIGYSIGERVLRPALVGVSAGAARAAEPQAPEAPPAA